MPRDMRTLVITTLKFKDTHECAVLTEMSGHEGMNLTIKVQTHV